MKHYFEEKSAVIEALQSSEEGLSAAEAQSRLEKNGKNKLVEPKRDSLIKKFFAEFADPMIIVLLVAAVLSAITAVYEGESLADVFIILFVVVLNATLGVRLVLIYETHIPRVYESRFFNIFLVKIKLYKIRKDRK